ncbi:hypothetical protein LCGC14_2670480, partial [marine sediment metagenome]
MNLGNSVVADLLSFSLGMLPSEWQRKAKQKFTHALLWDPLTANATLAAYCAATRSAPVRARGPSPSQYVAIPRYPFSSG